MDLLGYIFLFAILYVFYFVSYSEYTLWEKSRVEILINKCADLKILAIDPVIILLQNLHSKLIPNVARDLMSILFNGKKNLIAA